MITKAFPDSTTCDRLPHLTGYVGLTFSRRSHDFRCIRAIRLFFVRSKGVEKAPGHPRKGMETHYKFNEGGIPFETVDGIAEIVAKARATRQA